MESSNSSNYHSSGHTTLSPQSERSSSRRLQSPEIDSLIAFLDRDVESTPARCPTDELSAAKDLKTSLEDVLESVGHRKVSRLLCSLPIQSQQQQTAPRMSTSAVMKQIGNLRSQVEEMQGIVTNLEAGSRLVSFYNCFRMIETAFRSRGQVQELRSANPRLARNEVEQVRKFHYSIIALSVPAAPACYAVYFESI